MASWLKELSKTFCESLLTLSLMTRISARRKGSSCSRYSSSALCSPKIRTLLKSLGSFTICLIETIHPVRYTSLIPGFSSSFSFCTVTKIFCSSRIACSMARKDLSLLISKCTTCSGSTTIALSVTIGRLIISFSICTLLYVKIRQALSFTRPPFYYALSVLTDECSHSGSFSPLTASAVIRQVRRVLSEGARYMMSIITFSIIARSPLAPVFLL